MNAVQKQEAEVVPKAKRRSFTAKYKRETVREADACKEAGEIGALLRREGLYSSHLTAWRKEVEAQELAALAPKKSNHPADRIWRRGAQTVTMRA